MPSLVWNHFKKLDKKESKCNFCSDILQTSNGNTSALKKHLKKHPTELAKLLAAEKEREQSGPQAKKSRVPSPNNEDNSMESENAGPSAPRLITPTLAQFTEKFTKYGPLSSQQQEFDTSMVDNMCCTGIPFNWAAHPKTIELFNVANCKLTVKSRTTYSRMVSGRAESVMTRVNKIIAKHASMDLYSASFTTDNWTSRGNLPYMSLSLHYVAPDWKLECWCIKVSPCHGRHTAENLRVKLTDMMDQVTVPDTVDKFVTNDNAANITLAVEDMENVNEIRCADHTLNLGIKDTFENCPGMKTVLDICKKLSEYFHQSVVANDALKEACEFVGCKYCKPSNPNVTRWHSQLICLRSILKIKPALFHLMGRDDLPKIAELVPNNSQWQMIEGAVTILTEFEELGRSWEADKVPTVNRVVEGLYVKLEFVREWYKKSANKRHGVLFAKELESNIMARFPDCMASKFIYAAGNYIDPVFKGIHLKAFPQKRYLAKVKTDLELLSDKIAPTFQEVSDDEENNTGDQETEHVPLSPTSKLKKKHNKVTQMSEVFTSKFERECEKYEASPDPPKTCDRLSWWKNHESDFPNLSRCARYILGIPASSATSERFFSAAGLTVSALRTNLAEDKVEEILQIRLNLMKVEEHEKKVV